MANTTCCTAEGCDKKTVARGLCSAHYRHAKKNLPAPPCTVDGCEGKQYARGWCTVHYDRKRTKQNWKILTTEQRFWSQVDKTDTCWNWTGTVNVMTGYGYYSNRRVHRMAYEWIAGPIPKGMHIDHLCFNRVCVNPDHLRVVTQKQNNENLRGAKANSSTGIRGVWRCGSTGRWIAAVKNGDYLWSRRFATIEEAEAAAIARRNEVFTHNDVDRSCASD